MRKSKKVRITPLTMVRVLAGLVCAGATLGLVLAVLGGNDPATLIWAHAFTSAVLVSFVIFVLQWIGQKLRAIGGRR